MRFRTLPIPVLLLLLGAVSVAHAQRRGGLPPGADADGLSPTGDTMFVRLGAVEVRATRLPVLLATAPVAVTLLDGGDLAAQPLRSAADALREAGANVRAYGAHGSLGTASLRGLGPEYTAVLVNGMRLNDAQNGLVDLGRIPLGDVARIEIARGGFAALYGTDALGGVINILTEGSGTRTGVRAGAGSFGWRLAEAAAGMRGAAGRVQLSALYEEGRNDFPFHPQRDLTRPTMLRSGASFFRRRATADAAMGIGRTALTMYAEIGSSDAGTPGAVTGATQGAARQRDGDAALTLSLRVPVGDGMLTVSPALRSAAQHYTDPLLVTAGRPLDSRHDNTAASVAVTLDARPLPWLRLLPGVETAVAALHSSELPSDPRRLTLAAFAAADVRVGNAVRLYPALRVDAVRERFAGTAADAAPPLDAVSPSLGAHVTLLPGLLALRAQAARGFRAPTFNMRYWALGGNPALRPEAAWSFEAGTRWTPGGVLESVDLSAFHHDVRDKIVWMPGAGMWWSPRNIQHVRSLGLEAEASLALPGESRLRLHGQLLDARKVNASFSGDATAGRRLVYAPALTGGACADLRLNGWLRAAVTLSAVGTRQTTEENDPSRALPPFAVTDAALTASLPLAGTEFALKLEALNVFDARYEVIAWYPMPGRSFRITLSSHLLSSVRDLP